MNRTTEIHCIQMGYADVDMSSDDRSLRNLALKKIMQSVILSKYSGYIECTITRQLDYLTTTSTFHGTVINDEMVHTVKEL